MNKVRQLFLFTILIISSLSSYSQEKFTLSGRVKDSKTGEDLIGATLVVNELQIGTSSNEYGFFSITVPKGKYTVSVNYLSYKNLTQTIDLNENITQDFMMEDEESVLEEVVVSERKRDANVSSVQMSMNTITIKEMKKAPALFGEVDLIKNIQRLPGVQAVGEGTSAFFVRGGSADQNLILLDEAPVYNASHLFGIFSVFNADALKSAEIYRGGIPAQYGGRLASIVDIRSRDGNMKKLSGTASIGLLSARATIEGPIKKDKGSFILSGRRTYFDLFLRASKDKELRENILYFYDLNAKVNYTLGAKDRVFVAGYFGSDVFRSGDFGLNWANATGTFRWNHIFSNKLFSNTTLIFSDFYYGLGVQQGAQAFDWKASIREYSLKQDFSYFLNPVNQIKAGLQLTTREFQPGIVLPESETSIFKPMKLEKNHALEYALYVSNDQKITERVTMQYGLRYTIFQNNGARIFLYRDGRIDKKNITDTLDLNFNEVDKTYAGLEPRFGMRYVLTENTSVKLSYNRTYQFMHMLSNSAAPLPITMWVPSSRYIAPQTSDQVAAGVFKNFFDDKIEASIEGYYKWLNNTIDFKDNAQLLLNPTIEAEVLRGKGWSYGAEFFIKKGVGKTQANLGYTLSWTQLQIPGINNGNPYFASWDRRHNINLGVSHDFNDRWSFGANWTYGSGRPITLPAAKYYFEYSSALYFSERNGERTPAFHRLDLSVNLKSKKVVGRKWEGMWNFSLYNAYNRKNPFSVTTTNIVVQDPNDAKRTIATNNKKIIMLWLFPAIPSVTYTFSF